MSRRRKLIWVYVYIGMIWSAKDISQYADEYIIYQAVVKDQ